MPSPSRRTFLSAYAVAVAGCTSDPATTDTDSSSESPERSPSDTGSPSPTGDDDVERLSADDPAVRWAVRLPEPVESPPAVDPERARVYVGAGDHRAGTPTDGGGETREPAGAVFALRATDGEEEWRGHTDAPVVRRPVVHDGRVHAVTGHSTGMRGVDQRIAAFARDGTRRWTTDPTDDFLSVVAANGGTLFAGTRDDAVGTSGETLFAIGADGTVSWEREAGDAMGGTVADGRLLYSAGMQALTAYDPRDGTEGWQAGGDPLGNPTARVEAFDGLCFTESQEKTDHGYPLVARSTSDGTEQWRYSRPPGSGVNFVPTGVANVPESIDGMNYDPLIAGTEYGGAVFALGADGSERWTFTADADTPDGPVVGDAVYVGDNEGTVYALEPSEGTERWRASLPAAAGVRPLADGVLAFSSGKSQRVLASFDGDGGERWRYTTSRDLSRPVVSGDGVYAGAADGTVLAFAAGNRD